MANNIAFSMNLSYISVKNLFFVKIKNKRTKQDTSLERAATDCESRAVLHQYAVVSVSNFSVVFSPENHVGRAKWTRDRQTDQIFRDEPSGVENETHRCHTARHKETKDRC